MKHSYRTLQVDYDYDMTYYEHIDRCSNNPLVVFSWDYVFSITIEIGFLTQFVLCWLGFQIFSLKILLSKIWNPESIMTHYLDSQLCTKFWESWFSPRHGDHYGSLMEHQSLDISFPHFSPYPLPVRSSNHGRKKAFLFCFQ